MAKVCAICGKGNMAGRTIQHHHSIGWKMKAPKKPRTFKMNSRKVDIEVAGQVVRAEVCMKCYKKIKKNEK